MSRHRERDRTPPENSYEVGYGKPPLQTRFRKGESGNPKGRPRGSKNTATIVTEILDQKIPIRQNGKERMAQTREALCYQQAKKGIAGDLKATQFLFELDQMNRREAQTQPEQSATENLAGDLAIIEELLAMLPRDPTGATPSSETRNENHTPNPDDDGQRA